MKIGLLLRNSWGEIDWILPVLHRLAGLEPRARFVTLFPADGFWEQRALYPVLAAQLESVAGPPLRPESLLGERVDWAPAPIPGDVLLPRQRKQPPAVAQLEQQLRELREQAARVRQQDPALYREQYAAIAELERRARTSIEGLLEDRATGESDALEERLVAAFLDAHPPEGFDCVLRDHGTDFRFHRRLLERLDGIPVVRFPHGTMVQSHEALRAHPGFVGLQGSRMPDPADLFLVAREDDAAIHRHLTRTSCPVEAIGYPRYDEAWIEQTLSAAPAPPAGAQDRVLLITRGDSYLADDVRRQLLASAVELPRQRPSVHLIVKPHPRENLEALVEALAALPADRWSLWHGSVLEAARAASFVLSFWSSGMLDGLALGRPTAELYRFPRVEQGMPDGSPITHQWVVLPDGSVTSTFRALGLAEPAAATDDVLRLFDLARSAPDDAVWEGQRRAFARLHAPGADHASRAARAILGTARSGMR